ncbi:MAG: asparagine synthase (glutamine-hydrolyzing) [Bacteroidota bacterium]
MCGLAGYLNRVGGESEDAMQALARRMGDSIIHRGPDDGGCWVDPQAGIALSHRRLSIVDLSPLGHQPMVSACGRFVIAYNGEVYNFDELRRELSVSCKGHSDTEVILEACAAWGVEATVRRLIGMFAIALWDRAERTLWLVRDRLGIKPLYWGQFGDLVVFGSELKALVAQGGWTREVDREALSAYMRFGYVPAPRSIWKGVRKLQPGHILCLRPGADPVDTRFWAAESVAAAGLDSRGRFAMSDEEATDALETLLKDAVKRRMVADVPLGAFLSGGIDSSTVVALMQAQSDRPVKTFAIGFHEKGYNEAQHAKAVAAHLGTEHTELYVDPAHAQEIIPRLPEWYDEPFADSSQIPTFLVSEMTRQHVTVALSGDGGDELFAGYNRYALARSIWAKLGKLPLPVRQVAARLIKTLPPTAWDRIFGVVPPSLRPPQLGDKLHKLADILPKVDDEIYLRLVSLWNNPETVVRGGFKPDLIHLDRRVAAQFPDFLDRMQYLDLVTYLPDDILTKVDRASMAVALEARVPLIDHRVVEFAWSLPQKMKLRGTTSKWLLRQVLYRHVPAALVERPKMGFGIPLDQWLRGPLRDWAEDLLDERAVESGGYFETAPLRTMWADHLSGRRNWQYPLWAALMFQSWQRRNAG